VDVVVAGGHGQIAQHLLKLLADRGDRARGLIHNPDHAADLEALGAEAVVCDLESERNLSPYVQGAEAVVFAAGAGPGSGEERKRTVDLGGAVKLIEAAQALGIRRYVMVSSVGADDPDSASEKMRAYLQAKHMPTPHSRPPASTTPSSVPGCSPTIRARAPSPRRRTPTATRSRAKTWRASWRPCWPRTTPSARPSWW